MARRASTLSPSKTLKTWTSPALLSSAGIRIGQPPSLSLFEVLQSTWLTVHDGVYRIKEFQTLPLAKSKGALAQLVFTSSSDGRLHIYDLSQLPASAPTDGTPLEIQPALAHDTKGSRLTCLSVSGYLPGQGASAAGRVSVGGVVQTEDSDEDTSDSQNDDDEEEEDSDDDSDLDELAQEMPEIDSDISEEELAAAIAAQAQGSDDDDDEDEEEGEAWSGIQ